MTASQFFTSPFAISSITGIFTLSAALGSQWLTARANLKSKQIELESKRRELSYAQKSEAYQHYLAEALHFYILGGVAAEPYEQSQKNLGEYLKANFKARLVASDEVIAAMDKYQERPSTAENSLAPIQIAMQEDLKKMGFV